MADARSPDEAMIPEGPDSLIRLTAAADESVTRTATRHSRCNAEVVPWPEPSGSVSTRPWRRSSRPSSLVILATSLSRFASQRLALPRAGADDWSLHTIRLYESRVAPLGRPTLTGWGIAVILKTRSCVALSWTRQLNVVPRRTVPMTTTTLVRDSEDELIRDFLPLARRLAARFRGPGAEYEDLTQVASMALVKAAQRYEPGRGEFGVYASVTIVGELKRYLRDLSWSVRPPRVLQELGLQMTAESASISQADGQVPNNTKLAGALGRPVAELRAAALARSSRQASSLDQPAFLGARSLAETLADSATDIDRIEDRMCVAQLCSGLTSQDRQLLALRYVDGLTQREIGSVLGVSQMRVSRRLVYLLIVLRAKAAAPNAA